MLVILNLLKDARSIISPYIGFKKHAIWVDFYLIFLVTTHIFQIFSITWLRASQATFTQGDSKSPTGINNGVVLDILFYSVVDAFAHSASRFIVSKLNSHLNTLLTNELRVNNDHVLNDNISKNTPIGRDILSFSTTSTDILLQSMRALAIVASGVLRLIDFNYSILAFSTIYTVTISGLLLYFSKKNIATHESAERAINQAMLENDDNKRNRESLIGMQAQSYIASREKRLNALMIKENSNKDRARHSMAGLLTLVTNLHAIIPLYSYVSFYSYFALYRITQTGSIPIADGTLIEIQQQERFERGKLFEMTVTIHSLLALLTTEINSIQLITQAKPVQQRIKSYFESLRKLKRPRESTFNITDNNIQFNQVSVTYQNNSTSNGSRNQQNKEVRLLDSVDLILTHKDKNGKICIYKLCGTNRVDKTSVLKLIGGLHNPTSGAILAPSNIYSICDTNYLIKVTNFNDLFLLDPIIESLVNLQQNTNIDHIKDLLKVYQRYWKDTNPEMAKKRFHQDIENLYNDVDNNPQKFDLFKENLVELIRDKKIKKIAVILRDLDLELHNIIENKNNFSEEEKKIVRILQAIFKDPQPKWLILDKVFSGLDLEIKNKIQEIISKEMPETAIIYTDHSEEYTMNENGIGSNHATPMKLARVSSLSTLTATSSPWSETTQCYYIHKQKIQRLDELSFTSPVAHNIGDFPSKTQLLPHSHELVLNNNITEQRYKQQIRELQEELELTKKQLEEAKQTIQLLTLSNTATTSGNSSAMSSPSLSSMGRPPSISPPPQNETKLPQAHRCESQEPPTARSTQSTSQKNQSRTNNYGKRISETTHTPNSESGHNNPKPKGKHSTIHRPPNTPLTHSSKVVKEKGDNQNFKKAGK